MKNKSFIRKIYYLVGMAVLLIPLYSISAPSFLDADGVRTQGGTLTQLREENGLAQANLGEIDPASESMKLATLGMRGVAANLLWQQGNRYKKKEQWDNYRATLNQIAKLQPNFVSVWQHQAWNLSYNVSVEFDNYEHRYHWVKKGIDFLMEGIRYNRNEPRLLADVGWFFGHKIGRSDEYKQFRQKYNTDEDFHNSFAGKIDVNEAKNYLGQPDNWLTAHQWYNEAQRVVDLEGVTIKGKNPLVFHSDSAKALIRYADAIEEEGVFGEVARIAWQRAESRWLKYGDRDIPTSSGFTIQLNEGENVDQRVKEEEQKLKDLVPGLREKLIAERVAQLTDKQKALVGVDRSTLIGDAYQQARQVANAIAVTPDEMVRSIEDPSTRRKAKLLADSITDTQAEATMLRRYRDVVNFIYWRTRCEVEQQDRALDGRRYLYEANEAYRDIDLLGASEKYDQAWENWSSIHRDYPVLSDDVMAEDLVDAVKKYSELLGQLGEEEFPPKDFPMMRLLANFSGEFPELDREKLEQMADEYEAKFAKDGEATDDSSMDEKVKESPAEENMNEESAEEETVEAEVVPAAVEASETEEAIDLGASMSILTEAYDEYKQSNLDGALAKYEEAWPMIAKQLSSDNSLADDAKAGLLKSLNEYRALLGQLDKQFPPKDFPLADFVEENLTEPAAN